MDYAAGRWTLAAYRGMLSVYCLLRISDGLASLALATASRLNTHGCWLSLWLYMASRSSNCRKSISEQRFVACLKTFHPTLTRSDVASGPSPVAHRSSGCRVVGLSGLTPGAKAVVPTFFPDVFALLDQTLERSTAMS